MSHNTRSSNYVNPELAPLSASDVARFWAKVRRSETCWEWQASRMGSLGYGQFAWQAAPGQQVHGYAHRIAYALSHGSFPRSGHILHRCDNPLCVNPAHLFLGDQDANNKDAARKGRFHAPRPASQKLSDDEVSAILRLLAAGERGVDLARRFGVSRTFVSLIARGKRRQYSKVAAIAMLLLSLATPAVAQEPRWIYPVLIGAQVGDVVTTHQALKAGRSEVNPLLGPCANHLPCLIGVKAAVTSLLLASAEHHRTTPKRKSAFWVLVAVSAAQVAIDVLNWKVGR